MPTEPIDAPLPVELHAWLRSRGWVVVDVDQVVAAFAARAIYRIRVIDANQQTVRLVYKQLASDRRNEWTLYDLLSPALDNYAPRLLARIEEAESDGCGLLIEDVGVPLKRVYQAAPPKAQRDFVLRAVRWLTGMHLAFESASQRWLASGALGTYPVASSLSWVEESIDQVAWAAENGIGGVEPRHVRNLERRTERFYPHLESWMQGRQTLSHGDPHLDNLLTTRDQLRLVDWEFACVTVPQRDLAILLQDVLDESIQAQAIETVRDLLREAGWTVDDEVFHVGWQACFFDNTLMMLSWEIYQHRAGFLSCGALEQIIPRKLRWMDNAYQALCERM